MWGRCRRNVPEPRRFARRDLRAQPADGLEGMPSGPQQQIGPGRRFWVYRGLGRDVQNGNPGSGVHCCPLTVPGASVELRYGTSRHTAWVHLSFRTGRGRRIRRDLSGASRFGDRRRNAVRRRERWLWMPSAHTWGAWKRMVCRCLPTDLWPSTQSRRVSSSRFSLCNACLPSSPENSSSDKGRLLHSSSERQSRCLETHRPNLSARDHSDAQPGPETQDPLLHHQTVWLDASGFSDTTPMSPSRPSFSSPAMS